MSWPVGKVSDIAQVISGFAFKSEWFGDGDAKVVRIGDLKNGRINLGSAETFDDKANQVREQFRIKRGDILMALSGATVGKIAVADAEADGAYLNQRVAVIRGKCHENTEYLKYVFSGSPLQKLLLNAGGAAQPNLSPRDLTGMDIPLPPLSEQKRISAILDKADAIRRKRQQAIQLADEFLRAVFLDMFGDPVTNPKGWNVAKLGDVLEAIESGNSPKCDSRSAKSYEWGVLKLGAVTYCNYVANENKAVFPEYVPNPEYEVKAGDLLFSRKNTYELVAAVALIERTREKLLLPDLIFRLQTKPMVEKYFLWKLLVNTSMRRKVQSLASGAAGSMPNISKSNMKTIEIILPPLERQREFRDICLKYSALIERNKLLEQESENIFYSISRRFFSGHS